MSQQVAVGKKPLKKKRPVPNTFAEVFSKEKYARDSHNRIKLIKYDREHGLFKINAIQLESFSDFFQDDVEPLKRSDAGLEQLFRSTFPSESSDGNVRIEYSHYTVGEKIYTVDEAVEKDLSYVVPLKATIRLFLKVTGEVKEQEIFICDMPYMTDRGTFIINGAERVVVSQIHRSPGVVFNYNARLAIYHSRLIPNKGPWLEFEIIRDVFYARIDRKGRILLSTFIAALGIETKEKIIELFFEKESYSLHYSTSKKKKDQIIQDLSERRLYSNVMASQGKGAAKKEKPAAEDEDESGILLYAGSRLSPESIEIMLEHKIDSILLISEESYVKNAPIINAIDKEVVWPNQTMACKTVYNVIKESQSASTRLALKEIVPCFNCINCEHQWIDVDFIHVLACPECGQKAIERIDNSLFFKESNYSLGDVGRYKINKKFGTNIEVLSLCIEDIINTIKQLLKTKNGDVPLDDIDHLGNRRVRSVGEQLVNHLKTSFVRMERLAKDRIAIQSHSALTPQSVLSFKPVAAGVKEFFGTSQLSQFMDQVNPLSSVAHKRRVSGLGPGGLTRERAGFEVRDIHYTHYSRLCLIETPEGPNIGLIVSLAAFARINPYGFIESPYYKVKKGKVTNTIEFLSAIEEDRYRIAPFSVGNDERENAGPKGSLKVARYRGNYLTLPMEKIDYVDIAANQIVSLSASLIPFLEHDDANRALMGCNMMRQAVPLLFPHAPVVGTGLEGPVAAESGYALRALEAGTVSIVDNEKIEIIYKKDFVHTYRLRKSGRNNQDTFFNQRPIVHLGDKVIKGQVLTSSGAIDGHGELALGQNVLTAFMPWEGYNFEDAIVMSEELLKEDVYTSIHIEVFEVEARETKLGDERITRDIPNISEEDYKELDENGIITVGTKVKPGNILVGKLAPKSQNEVTPEFRLLYSIFGEKVRDVKDSSLRVPHGTEGTIISVRRYTSENRGDLRPGVIEKVKVFLAKKGRLREGDKFAGRHGNKGIVARIIPQEDMPFLEDGRPVQLVLNPLGVPSRMNIGQVMETVLGMAGLKAGVKFATPVFNSIGYDKIKSILEDVGLPKDGKYTLYDGRTGEAFKNRVTVGLMYYLKLAHLADEKIHARSTGPYSLVTQQPLGGKAYFGGQRVGEMEVWAVQAYGAANILQEFVTVKSDAIEGRTRIYEGIVRGNYVSAPDIPESFNVLVRELRGLGLNIEMFDEEDNIVNAVLKKKQEDTHLV